MAKKEKTIKEKKEYFFINLEKEKQIIGLLMAILYLGILKSLILKPLLGLLMKDTELIDTIASLLRNIILLVAYIILLRKNIVCFIKDFAGSKFKDNFAWIMKGFLFLFIARFSYAIVVVGLKLSMKNRYNELFGTGPQNELALDRVRNTFPVVIILFSIVVAPILEEVVFRYVVYHAMRKINKYLAMIAVPLFFSIIHVTDEIGSGNYLQAAFYMLSYLTLAIPLTVLYEKRKNLIFCIILHAASNLIAEIL